MPLSPGDKLGSYEILSLLGKGGMGEVYRARDPKLNRDVAIKVLPPALATDPDYILRFQREAQTLAALNHPNIASIYGLEANAIVMELVEGDTLQGPLPIAEALPIAKQIAEALEAAHDKGIIHRDLKPGNIKLTPEGVVKVLDFGLAKAITERPTQTGPDSPTLTLRATEAGLILGTAGYMSPEQAAGKPVDRRADIWSFGVVLHELLIGKRLFDGETVSHTLASVLKDPIDFDLPQVPPPIRRLLARCLNRNPKERLRDIGEARIAIRHYLANPSAEVEPKAPEPGAVPPGRNRQWVLRALCAVLFLSLAAALGWIYRPIAPPPVTRFPLLLPQDLSLSGRGGTVGISPDGTQIAYVANDRLFLRTMAGLEPRQIVADSDGKTILHPTFSPDGKSIAFYQAGALRQISSTGGSPVTICSSGRPFGMSWSPSGLVFGEQSRISRVSPNGGQSEILVAAKDGESKGDPFLLPGGQAVLFVLAGTATRGTAWNKPGVVAQNLKSGVRKALVPGATAARYLPTGHLAYLLNGAIHVAPFNPGTLEITGAAVAVVEGVAKMHNYSAEFAFSDTGTLIYLPGSKTAGDGEVRALVRFDRNIKADLYKNPPASIRFPRISRDGARVVYEAEDGAESAIWVWALAGDYAPRRLTLPGKGANRFPIWSPDGQRIAFQSDRAGDFGIWVQRADGNGEPERLTTPAKGVVHITDSWSPDGQTILFTEDKGKVSEVFGYSLRDREVTLVAASPGEALGSSAFSPDGRWVAYQSQAQLGRNSRIYVRPFPPTSEVYIAPSHGDSHHPVWSPDGKELIYVAGPGRMGSMSISTRSGVGFGVPAYWQGSGYTTLASSAVREMDVLPDGQHMIGTANPSRSSLGEAESRTIQVVLNWFEDVKARAPVR